MPGRSPIARASWGRLLDAAYFERDAPTVACELLGTIIASEKDGVLVAGRIVETEAYLGAEDAGSHAATKGVTVRNRVMYGPPGTAYVYFTYGNHHMLNLVTCPDGTAGAVLVRALEPIWGIDAMTARRAGRALVELTNGPGKLAEALGVDLGDNGIALDGSVLGVYAGFPPKEAVVRSGRIGLSAGHELALRYYLEGSPFVSPGRPGPRSPKRRGRSGRG